MTGVLYALNVGTLTVWTTVAGAGLVSFIGGEPHKPDTKPLTVLMDQNTGEGELVDLLPESGSPEPGPADPSPPEAQEQEQTAEVETPPEMPDLPDIPPPAEIPDMPDLPAKPVVKAQPSTATASDRPKEKPVVKSSASGGSGRPSNQSQPGTGSGTGNGKGTGTGNGSAPGNGKAGGDGARLQKGNIPRPTYPQACRDAGQAGTVTIFFTVDPSGHVINARVAKPCPYAPLNEAALNAVKRGTFPPGSGTLSANKPITFNLKDG